MVGVGEARGGGRVVGQRGIESSDMLPLLRAR